MKSGREDSQLTRPSVHLGYAFLISSISVTAAVVGAVEGVACCCISAAFSCAFVCKVHEERRILYFGLAFDNAAWLCLPAGTICVFVCVSVCVCVLCLCAQSGLDNLQLAAL